MLNKQHTKNTDPVTSYLAGEEITLSGKRETQTKAVEIFVGMHEGLTSAELSAANDKEHYMVADRYVIARRLSDAMRVRRGEHRKCRISGRMAVTWWVR